VENGKVTAHLAADLSNVRASLAHAIEIMAPHAATIAVLGYYQPIPSPAEIIGTTAASAGHTNLVCSGLKLNAASTYAAARVVLAALNAAIADAVADARAHHTTNVTLIDISNTMDGHGICTADPWVFSGEPVPDATLAAAVEHVLAARACRDTDALHGEMSCASLSAQAVRAESGLEGYVWRAAHPAAAGQRAIAALVVRRLRGKV
jgi:hypothetical protein